MAKIRKDAKLKGLPLNRQSEVIAVIDECGITEAALERLSGIGIEVRSLATLSRFYAWYNDPIQRVARDLEAYGNLTEFYLDHERRGGRKVDPKEQFERGQQMFAEMAIAMRDPKTWLATQTIHRERERVDLKAKELDLAERKFRRDTARLYLEWAEDQRAREIVTSGATQAEKIERLGRVMFGDLWEPQTV